MKKIILFILATLISYTAFADFTFIVPQKPGGGTDMWTRLIASELEKKLGEKILIKNIPGINDMPGFNKFHNELQHNDKTVMVAHGGNAESFLVQDVDYNYFKYDPIALQNLTIMVGKRFNGKSKVKMSAGSGINPDVMAVTLMICGNMSLKNYKKCFDNNIIYVKGMGKSERRLAYVRGELNTTRENPLAFKKHATKTKENIIWFSHGVLNLNTKQIVDDPNHPNLSFTQVYEKTWNQQPTGEFFQAYLLVKSYRDALQKSMWIKKDSQHTTALRKAFRNMLNDQASLAKIQKKTGQYEFIVGNDVKTVLQVLGNLKSENNLKNLKWIISNLL